LYALVSAVSLMLTIQSAPAELFFPTLRIASSNEYIVVSWPVSASNSVLETTSGLSPEVWTDVLTPISLTENEIIVMQPLTNVQQLFRLKRPPIPVFQFAVFYNDLLEFSTCATMTIAGPVHANGPIYTGSSSPLTFNDTVTTSSAISSPANNGSGPWAFPGNVSFNAGPQYVTNTPALMPPIGTNNLHALIEMPPSGEDPLSLMGKTRFFHQAQIIILVSNTTVTARIQASPGAGQVPGADPSPLILVSTNAPAALSTNFPFLTTTNTFLDQREDKTSLVAHIDVGKYARWINTNVYVLAKFPPGSGAYPAILYVANNRTNTSSQLPVVRLANGSGPPINGGLGWSVATPNPLYVLGNYNCTNAAHLATTNTTSTVPCAFMSDALTVLSLIWTDADSFTISPTGPNASASTTINAAILTGIKYSTSPNSSGFSGGVHNLPRLLENWTSSRHLWLNTSIVNLYNSTEAIGQFVAPGSGGYYVPPTRHFSFDSNFLDPNKLPPGTPLVSTSWPAN
jgi:hypothetical protein